jgi:hypothetical protein
MKGEKMTTNSINHTYVLKAGNNYYNFKTRIQEMLRPWNDMFQYDDALKEIRYKTEGPLIPKDNGKKPVLILLSNPHPHSVKQGMFLSPNRVSKENPFWQTMRSSKYFRQNGSTSAAAMIQNHYDSPFRFFMHVLLPFPSEDPGDLTKLFGSFEYNKMLKEGKESIRKLVLDNEIKHIVCFSKLPYDAVSDRKSPKQYTTVLQNGEMIVSNCWFSKEVRVYLTFPTGWRFVKNASKIKTESLSHIFECIANNK